MAASRADDLVRVMSRILAVALAVFALSCTPSPIAADGIFFPRHSGSYEDIGMLALLSGRIELRQDCLVIALDGNDWRLVFWAREYSLRRDGDELWIFDGDDRFARVGERVNVGGGEWPAEAAEDLLPVGTSVPDRCRAEHYWIGHKSATAQ